MVKLHLTKEFNGMNYALDEDGYSVTMLCAHWVTECLKKSPEKLTVWIEAEESGNIEVRQHLFDRDLFTWRWKGNEFGGYMWRGFYSHTGFPLDDVWRSINIYLQAGHV